MLELYQAKPVDRLAEMPLAVMRASRPAVGGDQVRTAGAQQAAKVSLETTTF